MKMFPGGFICFSSPSSRGPSLFDRYVVSDQPFSPYAPGYETLSSVLQRAFDQAARGKGAERHADDKPFHEQPMQWIADAVGPGFLLGQVIKKVHESQGLPRDAAVHELLGAINYLAGAVIHLEAQPHA